MHIQKVLIPISIGLILFGIWQGYRQQHKTVESFPQKSEAVSSILPQTNYNTRLLVGNVELQVEIANTLAAQTQGLSSRESLSDTQGMLFDLHNRPPSKPTFWMHNMKFDLDMIWINNFTVVDVTKNIPKPKADTPLAKLPLYSPKQNVDMVLEVSSGWSDTHDIKIGDTVTLP